MDVDLYDTLAGQIALVTGANRGIGERIAADLSELGATVYAGARDPDAVEATDQRPVRLDVTVEAQIEAAIETIADEADGLDVLVNNAGVYGPTGRFEDVPTDEIDRTLDTDLRGPMLVTKRALSLLRRRDGARVVNVSSGSGQFGDGIDARHLPYGVAKAGLNAFTNALDAQYDDVFVNTVCPGWVRTDMGGPGATRSVEKGAETPVWLARFREGPSGRLWRDEAIVDW